MSNSTFPRVASSSSTGDAGPFDGWDATWTLDASTVFQSTVMTGGDYAGTAFPEAVVPADIAALLNAGRSVRLLIDFDPSSHPQAQANEFPENGLFTVLIRAPFTKGRLVSMNKTNLGVTVFIVGGTHALEEFSAGYDVHSWDLTNALDVVEFTTDGFLYLQSTNQLLQFNPDKPISVTRRGVAPFAKMSPAVGDVLTSVFGFNGYLLGSAASAYPFFADAACTLSLVLCQRNPGGAGVSETLLLTLEFNTVSNGLGPVVTPSADWYDLPMTSTLQLQLALLMGSRQWAELRLASGSPTRIVGDIRAGIDNNGVTFAQGDW